MNVLTVCKLMPLLDKQTLLTNLNNIFHICLITVHSEMMKKLDSDFNYERRNIKSNPKSLNIRQSFRKKMISENDSLLNIDLHALFVENFKVKFILMSKNF